VGYRFHRHFATELQAEYLFGFDLKVDGVKPVTYEILTATANAKLFLAAKDIQPYALVGLGYLYASANDNSGLDVSVDEHGPAFRSGGGLDFYFSDNTLVSLEATYVLPFEKVEDLDYLTIGLGFQYRF
jgi:opacity protein-like surface antigen